MKRIFDFFVSLLGLLISSPLWVIFGLATWLEDRGSIFYSQERVGKDGKSFKIMKFRSMIIDAEENSGPLQAKEDDSRTTKIGKIFRATAMDELPQLWNILKGDMSFVGPKALRPVEIDSKDTKPRSVWEFEGFKERSSVRPGLTGIAQIFLTRDASRDLKFKYDRWYIKNQTFWLDLYLILFSFMITFMGKWEIRQDKFAGLGRRLRKIIEKDIN